MRRYIVDLMALVFILLGLVLFIFALTNLPPILHESEAGTTLSIIAYLGSAVGSLGSIGLGLWLHIVQF